MPLDFGENIDQAIADCHLPALMCALVHLTGSADHLKPQWRPTYPPLQRDEIGVAEEGRANMRPFLNGVVRDYLARGREPLGGRPLDTDRRQRGVGTGVPTLGAPIR